MSSYILVNIGSTTKSLPKLLQSYCQLHLEEKKIHEILFVIQKFTFQRMFLEML